MKNQDTPKSPPQDKGNSQNQNQGSEYSNPRTNPYDSENLDRESDAGSKDITEKDIEKNLIENDPSQGFETDIDNDKNNQHQSDAFETIQPDKDNPFIRNSKSALSAARSFSKTSLQGTRQTAALPASINLPNENFNQPRTSTRALHKLQIL
jgi:hypothetical protein